MMLVFGVIYAVLIEIFLRSAAHRIRCATAEIMPYAKEYTRITANRYMPFLIVNNG